MRGTERLLRALKEFEVEQFVFASTMLVHAPGKKGQPIDEDWPLDPKLPYRASKVRTEKLIREQHGDIPVAIVRPPGSTTICAAPPSSRTRSRASMNAS